MTKATRLKQEAKESAIFRGHNMTKFRHYLINGREHYESTCKTCERYVVVCLEPTPNEIDIGGTAVALSCQPIDVH